MDIFVGNLPYDIEESEITDLFSVHGAVERVKLLTDRETGRSRGIAFVTMNDFKAAQTAIKAMDGQSVGGRAIKVNQAQERNSESRGSGGGYRRTGGYRGATHRGSGQGGGRRY